MTYTGYPMNIHVMAVLVANFNGNKIVYINFVFLGNIYTKWSKQFPHQSSLDSRKSACLESIEVIFNIDFS